MKPAAFAHHAPRTVEQALATLGELGSDAKVLAGGQSLVPLLNMRLATPAALVDIERLDALDTVEVDEAGVRVGARARQGRLHRDGAALAAIPLLGQALDWVAHPVIRNRGTVVGSITHADPAAELPAVLALLGGHVEVASLQGARTVPAAEFLLGPLESDVRPGELAVAATFPRPAPGTRSAFVELSRRHGDYALAGVAVTVTLDVDRRATAARAAFVGVSDTPAVVDLGPAVEGRTADALDHDLARALADDAIDPDGDIHASAAYRRHLAGVLLARALQRAVDGTDDARDAVR